MTLYVMIFCSIQDRCLLSYDRRLPFVLSGVGSVKDVVVLWEDDNSDTGGGFNNGDVASSDDCDCDCDGCCGSHKALDQAVQNPPIREIP